MNKLEENKVVKTSPQHNEENFFSDLTNAINAKTTN